MPAVIIPNGVRVVIRGTHLGNEIVNVFGYRSDTPPASAAELLEFLNAWAVNHTTEYLAIKSADYTLIDVTATDISTAGGAQATFSYAPGTVGTSSPASAPGNVAGVISWRTDLSGRRNRGRSYIGPLPNNGFVGDTMDSDVLPFMTAFAEGLIEGGLGEEGFDFAIMSVADLAMKVVTAFIIDVILDSQRRRLTGRGS